MSCHDDALSIITDANCGLFMLSYILYWYNAGNRFILGYCCLNVIVFLVFCVCVSVYGCVCVVASCAMYFCVYVV